MTENESERASLHGLTPEEALRALLAVDPSAPEADEPEDDEAPAN